jgi:hypothetical protein
MMGTAVNKRPSQLQSSAKQKKQKKTEKQERQKDESDGDDAAEEVDCLQVMVTGEDGKQRIEYEPNYGALMGTGRYETFNESRVSAACLGQSDRVFMDVELMGVLVL